MTARRAKGAETDERKADAAAKTGLAANKIETFRLEIRRLKRAGLLVDVDTAGMGRFVRRTTWAEVGITDDDIRRELMASGHKFLIPRKRAGKYRSLEQRARQVTAKWSVSLGAFGNYRLILFTAFPKWKEEWDALVAELEQMKQEDAARLPAYVDDAKENFRKGAERAWSSLVAKRRNVSEAGVTVDKMVFKDRAAFVKHVVSQALAQMPTADEVLNDIRVDFRTAVLASDTDLEKEALELEKVQAKEAVLRAKVAEAQARADVELEKVYTEKLARAEKIAAVRAAELEAARRQIEQQGSPVVEMLDQVMAEVGESVTQMLESVNKNHHLRGKVAEQGHRLAEFYRLMSGGMKNAELDAKLHALEEAIGPVGVKRKAQRDTGAVTAALAQLKGELAAQRKTLAASGPNRFSMLEIDEDED